MGFFETFWIWLNTALGAYIGDNTARVSAAMEPAIVTLTTLYVMVWGYLQLTGQIQEPFVPGLKRILTVAIVLGVSLRMWLYNTIIVDTFYTAPAQLGAAIIGASDPVHTIDSIWEHGGGVAGYLYSNGGFFHDLDYALAAIVVWVLMALLCVYTMFLIALSHVALAILLALGPFFIAMLLFESTKRLFDAWLALLANYALITVLTIMAAALLLRIVDSYATQTAARGAALVTVDALNMVLVAVLVFLFMRQVMPIAASLAGGTAFNTFGTVSRAISWSARTGMDALRERSRRKAVAALLSRDRD
ncbi:MAG: type IV secretion system protein [Steroidobacteraceae bacterium]